MKTSMIFYSVVLFIIFIGNVDDAFAHVTLPDFSTSHCAVNVMERVGITHHFQQPDTLEEFRPALALTIQQTNGGFVQLNWETYPDVYTYVVFVSAILLPVDSAGWIQIGEVTGTSYTDTSLVPHRFYHVRPKVVLPPMFEPPSGFYEDTQTIQINCATNGASIRYTTNYWEPNPYSNLYQEPLNLIGTYPITIKAGGFKTGWISSNIVKAVYSTPPVIYQPVDVPNSIQQVIDDMILPGEGIPHGILEYWDWYDSSAVHVAIPDSSFHAFTCWGQCYEEVRGNPASNTRVQIRNMRAYYFCTTDHMWKPLQHINPIIDGAWYPEDFSGASIPADMIRYPDGSVSATAGNGKCFHFWIRDRASIDNLAIGGIYVTMEAKLIVADDLLPDDRLEARYILNGGGDYWTGVTGGVNTYGDIGVGRFKYVTTSWRSFNFCTFSAAELGIYPPPLN